MSDDEILRQFGERVRELRQKRGLSQEELARAAGLHRTYVSDIERGKRNVALMNIARLARALGKSVGELTEGVELRNSAS